MNKSSFYANIKAAGKVSSNFGNSRLDSSFKPREWKLNSVCREHMSIRFPQGKGETGVAWRSGGGKKQKPCFLPPPPRNICEILNPVSPPPLQLSHHLPLLFIPSCCVHLQALVKERRGGGGNIKGDIKPLYIQASCCLPKNARNSTEFLKKLKTKKHIVLQDK